MSKLEPVDQALLDLAREGHDPTDEDRARVRGHLAGRLGMGAGLALASTTVASASGAASVVGGATAAGGGVAAVGGGVVIGAKVLAGLAVVALLGGGSVAYVRATSAGPAPKDAVVSSQVSRAVPEAKENHAGPPSAGPPSASPPRASPVATTEYPRAPVATSSPALEAPSASPITIGSPLGRSSPPPVPSPSSAPSSISEALPPPSPPAIAIASTTLEAETRLVHAGLAALHGGDAVRALAFFDEHARSYPNGVLAEERDVERIEALCTLGRSDAVRVAASTFLRAHPGSPLVQRVRASCAAAH
jgi:hypothetical protein